MLLLLHQKNKHDFKALTYPTLAEIKCICHGFMTALVHWLTRSTRNFEDSGSMPERYLRRCKLSDVGVVALLHQLVNALHDRLLDHRLDELGFGKTEPALLIPDGLGPIS